MKRLFLFALPLLTLLTSCNQNIKYSVATPTASSNGGKNAPAKPGNGIQKLDGKCFQKCIVPDRYASAWVKYPIYTGSDTDAPTRVETLLVTPSQNKWVKKESGEISLEQSPAVTKEVRVLADTLFYKDFRLTRFEYKTLVEKGGSLRETQVLCSDERTPNLFLQISTILKSYGYLASPTAQWDMKFSQAIQKFQQDSSLPVGDLNLETLQLLGI